MPRPQTKILHLNTVYKFWGQRLFLCLLLTAALLALAIPAALAKSAPGEADAAAGPVFYHMPEMFVNLIPVGRGRHILKLRVDIELRSQADMELAHRITPRLQQAFQIHLREYSMRDLQDAFAIEQLKRELLEQANAQAGQNDMFREVLVQEMIVQ